MAVADTRRIRSIVKTSIICAGYGLNFYAFGCALEFLPTGRRCDHRHLILPAAIALSWCHFTQGRFLNLDASLREETNRTVPRACLILSFVAAARILLNCPDVPRRLRVLSDL